MSDICVLGNFVADNTFYAEKLPAKGQTIFGSGFQVGPGGKGSNQAIAAARLNSKVCFLGKVGDDEYGKIAIELYKKNNLNHKECLMQAFNQNVLIEENVVLLKNFINSFENLEQINSQLYQDVFASFIIEEIGENLFFDIL